MLNGLTLTALFGNFYYHHQELIKTFLRLKEKEQRPILTDEDDFDLPKGWDAYIKEKLNSIIKDCEKKSEIKITDNKKYRGEVKTIQKEKVPFGKGILEFTNGKKIVGTFENGELNGEGGIIEPSGFRVMGNFKNGKLDGIGEIVYDNKRTYRGKFKEGTGIEKGRLNWADDHFCILNIVDEESTTAKCFEPSKELYYIGDYKNYHCTGKGKVYFGDAQSYEGDVYEGILEGYGVRKDKYGDELYRGPFSNNEFKGKLQNREVVGYITIGVVNIILSLLIRK